MMEGGETAPRKCEDYYPNVALTRYAALRRLRLHLGCYDVFGRHDSLAFPEYVSTAGERFCVP